MQPPGSGSGASLAGTTGRAPPLVRPPGSSGVKGISLDEAIAASVSGVAAIGCAATATPHATVKTKSPALARSAIVRLPSFVIAQATTAGTGVGGHRSDGHQWISRVFPLRERNSAVDS